MPSHDPAETLGLDREVLAVTYLNDRFQFVCAVCGRRADMEYSARCRVEQARISLYLCEPCTVAALTVTFKRLLASVELVGEPDARVQPEYTGELPF